MADLAFICHWRPADMEGMALFELLDWWRRIRGRYRAARGRP